jgi:hypothetical protein
MRRPLTPTVLTAAAVAGVVTFSLVASAPLGNAAARPSSAYAVSADGQVPIPKTPYAESLDGKRQTTSALELPKNPLLSVRAGTASAGNDSASVELFDIVVGPDILSQVKVPPELKQQCANLPKTGASDLPLPDLALPDLGLPGLPGLPALSTKDLPVKNLPDLCNLLLTPPKALLAIDSLNVWCSGDKGGIDIGSLTLLGQTVKVPTTTQGASLPSNPLASIKVNSQAKHSDGAFTVTGLSIDLGGGAETINLASATCAKPAAKPKPTPTVPVDHPAPPQTNTPPAAPVPTPVKTHQAVTG